MAVLDVGHPRDRRDATADRRGMRDDVDARALQPARLDEVAACGELEHATRRSRTRRIQHRARGEALDSIEQEITRILIGPHEQDRLDPARGLRRDRVQQVPQVVAPALPRRAADQPEPDADHSSSRNHATYCEIPRASSTRGDHPSERERVTSAT